MLISVWVAAIRDNGNKLGALKKKKGRMRCSLLSDF